MGAKKTGRKKRSEYRRYKKYLHSLKVKEKAIVLVREITMTAIDTARMAALCSPVRSYPIGGIIYSNVNDDISCKSGELVIPTSREDQEKNSADAKSKRREGFDEWERKALEEADAVDYDSCLLNCDH